MQYDLVDLKVFVSVCELGSLSRAAEHQFLSVPAVSLRMKQLEERLGLQLLVRKAQGVEPTAAGLALNQRALEVIHTLECLNSDLMLLSSEVKGTLRLLANTIATNTFLAPALASFLKDHPQVEVNTVEAGSEAVLHGIINGRADLGIAIAQNKASMLDYLNLAEEELVLVTSPTFSSGTSISFEEVIASEPFVGFNEESSLQAFLQARSAELGYRLRMRANVNSFDAMVQMVEAGIGSAIVPRSYFASHPISPSLALLAIDEEWARRRVFLVWLKKRKLPGFAGPFGTCLKWAASQVRHQRP